MNQSQNQLFRKLYSDIIQGHTKASFGMKDVFIKHFTSIDQGIIDQKYIDFFDSAVKNGLPTFDIKLEQLKKNKVWTEEDENDISDKKFYIENLQKTKVKLRWFSEIENITKQIKEAEIELAEKLNYKNSLLDLTAENFAQKKVNEVYLFKSLFVDDQLERPLFTPEDFASLDGEEINDLSQVYNNSLKDFEPNNLKRVGLEPFFQNMYCLCDNNPFSFYGKPVVYLTFYQTEIFSYGRFFYNILSSDIKPPEELLKDPDKLMDWYISSNNTKNIQDESKEGNTVIFGASSQDLKMAGISKAIDDPATLARRKGRSITAQDLL